MEAGRHSGEVGWTNGATHRDGIRAVVASHVIKFDRIAA